MTLIVANCGGGSDTGAVPGVPQQQTEQFITKDVSGYIYYSPSPEDSEIDKRFVILNAPLTGDDSFLNQLSSYFQESNPEFWNSSEMQALYGTMSSEMAKWIPLPAYSPDARLYGIYQDSKSGSPINVNSDGYFETSLQVKPTDANVSFEVVTGDSACYPVEGVSTSDITISEEGTTELISCPEQVITLPGWFVIFAVRGEPAVNLKDSGLAFTLNDPSVGWVTDPFYLKCMGAWNYNIAYGIFLAKPGLSTPVSTTITAQTVTGLSINIFTEVVKSCASLSGHVGGAGVIPEFGFVYSLGFDAFSCLDEAGNYTLDKVFQGHFRNVTAVYWIQENGVLTKHREERVINFFDGDLVNFDLPEGIQPTPTISPYYYYDPQMITILDQLKRWEKQFGVEYASQQGLDWLNGRLSDGATVPEGVIGARISEIHNVNYVIEVLFVDGAKFCVDFRDANEIIDNSQINQVVKNNIHIEDNLINTSQVPPPEADVIKDVLILSPFGWQWSSNRPSVVEDFADELTSLPQYTRVEKGTPDAITRSDGVQVIDITFGEVIHTLAPTATPAPAGTPTATPYPETSYFLFMNPDPNLTITSNDIVTPQDYDKIGDYDMVYIISHMRGDGLVACPAVRDSQQVVDFQNQMAGSPGVAFMWYDISPVYIEHRYITTVDLGPAYFQNLRPNNFNPPLLVYICACGSAKDTCIMPNTFVNRGVKLYLGHNLAETYSDWEIPLSYYLFHYMLYGVTGVWEDYEVVYYPQPYEVNGFNPFGPWGGNVEPGWTVPNNRPMNVQEALETLRYYNVSPSTSSDPKVSKAEIIPYTSQGQLTHPYSDDFPRIYFGGNVQVIVQEE